MITWEIAISIVGILFATGLGTIAFTLIRSLIDSKPIQMK